MAKKKEMYPMDLAELKKLREQLVSHRAKQLGIVEKNASILGRSPSDATWGGDEVWEASLALRTAANRLVMTNAAMNHIDGTMRLVKVSSKPQHFTLSGYDIGWEEK